MANRRFIDFPIATTVGNNDIVLIWQDGLNKQTTKATLFQGSPQSLAGLTDVDISALNNGQILQYNSTTSKWENVDRTDINLSELGDVTIVAPANGQVLVYNSSTGKWENSSGGYVPYTGAVTTVNLGAQSILAGSFVKAGGTAAQFLKANGSVDSTAYETGSVTSVALTMPTAFSVAGSPITTAGTLAVTATGTTGQYIRGDGSLATLPSPGSGTVTSVAALTLGTAGTDLSSSVANPTTTPVITLNVPTASATNRGALSSADWSTFNSKQNALGFTPVPETRTITINGTTQDLSANRTYNVGTVTSVGLSSATSGVTIGSTPVTTSGTITLAIATASGSQNGLLSSTDWSTFNGKENAITAGTTAQYFRGDKTFQTLNTSVVPELTNLYYTEARVNANTNVAANTAARHNAVTLGTANGLSLSTQVLSLGLASAGVTGALSGTDWSTFNGKQNALTNPVTGTGTTNYLPKFTGSTTIGNSSITDNGTEIVLNGLSRFTAGGFDTYISQSFGNTINFGYNANTYPYDGWVNYRGFQNGTTQFRNFRVGDGKENAIASFIGSTGNLLVGTTTDAGFKLDVNGTGRFSGSLSGSGINAVGTTLNNNNAVRFYRAGLVEMGYIGWSNENTNNSTWLFKSTNGNPIAFSADGVNQQLFINTNGNVGIGTTNPSAAAGLALAMNSGANQCRIALKTSSTGDASGDGFQIGVAGVSAFIEQRENADLTLATNATERMRITSGGYTKSSNNGVYVNSTGAFHESNQNLNDGQIAVMRHSGNSSPIGLEIAFTGADPNNASNYMLGAYTTSGGFTWIYRIFSNGTVSARSDARWKKNIETTRSGYIDDLCKLRVVKYNWYNHQDDAPKELGLIAQEVEEVFPNLIQHDPVICKKQVEQKDGTFVEEEYQDGTSRSIKVSVLPYMLLKAIQEQQKQIEELKSKLL